MEVFSLKPDRADVIVPAAEIFLGIADSVGAKMVIVPSLGLVDGIINEMAEDYKNKYGQEKAKTKPAEDKKKKKTEKETIPSPAADKKQE